MARPNPQRRKRMIQDRLLIASLRPGVKFWERIGGLVCYFVKREDNRRTLIEITGREGE
jgi:hypothetical protein